MENQQAQTFRESAWPGPGRAASVSGAQRETLRPLHRENARLLWLGWLACCAQPWLPVVVAGKAGKTGIQCAARLTRHRAIFDFSVSFLLRLSLLLGLIALLTAR